MKPKLYQYAACPFCNKVTSILAYKKVDFDVVEVHPLNKKEIAFSTDYRAVPIYIDSKGQQVNDSTAIMKHIDEEFPSSAVFATEAEKKEQEEKWLAWSEKLVRGLPTVVYDNLLDSIKAFDYITKTGKFSWVQSRLIKYSGAFVMTLVAKKIRTREAIEDPQAFLEKKTQEWAEGLKGKKFMAGETPGAADLAVFGICRAVGELKAAKTFEKNQDFWTWLERMKGATGLTLSIV
ncbi:MAG: glutathione S-transferase N-terminal domain-containing protein [Candidatus Omnitrophota bacterium]|nr:glutathione S-transferase N-terminal domain-containing protein [Candidatus Omnitrophota bacterium]